MDVPVPTSPACACRADAIQAEPWPILATYFHWRSITENGNVMHSPFLPPSSNAAASAQQASLPDTTKLSSAEKYLLYEDLAAQGGAPELERELAEGRRIILGIRIITNTHASEGLGLYDDRFVVLWRDEAGKYAAEFQGNTEPSAFYEDVGDARTSRNGNSMGVDVDGDGRQDLGCIPVGTYTYYKSQSKKFGNVLRSRGAIRSLRDSNHDGFFDGEDLVKPSLQQGLEVNDFLFHAGLPDRTGSAGCQTFRPDEYHGFWDALGEQEEFLYILINAPTKEYH
ncbi:hypothetical protein [Streptomyces sp. NPDC126514]|uniref:hypothetical protein n=1 Tax=Streptomyces sp. NPDC126514 TaxID=3155210 RepID=UPI0033283256